MNTNVPILISDNSFDLNDPKVSIQTIATNITKDLKTGQFLLAGAKLKILEEVAKSAKEQIKDHMKEEFSLRSSKMVPISGIECRMKSKQDLDYTTCEEWNKVKARLDRIQEKMKICDKAYFDEELKCQIQPPAKKEAVEYLEFRMK